MKLSSTIRALVTGLVFAFGGGIAVADARSTTADIVASNGVIHVIDTMVLPR